MTIEKMNDLYKRKLYSSVNYYLGLLALLKEGADLGVIMGQVPETLLRTILDVAGRHRKSKDEKLDLQEVTITENILAWGNSHSIHRLRVALNFTVEQFALQLEVPPRMVTSWERGESVPTKAVQKLLDAMEVFLTSRPAGRRVASSRKRPVENGHTPTRKSTKQRSVDEGAPKKRPGEGGGEAPRSSRVVAEKSQDGSDSGRMVAAKMRTKTEGGNGGDHDGEEGVTKPKRRRSKPGDIQ